MTVAASSLTNFAVFAPFMGGDGGFSGSNRLLPADAFRAIEAFRRSRVCIGAAAAAPSSAEDVFPLMRCLLEE